MTASTRCSFLLLLAIAGCGTGKGKGTAMLTPEEAERWGLLPPQGTARPGRHVIRMSDGMRDWEVEFPEVATGYEVRIPLRGGSGAVSEGGGGGARMTAADRELFEGSAEAAGKGKRSDRARPSYLAGIARLRELYKNRSYELALVSCVDLEREYPNDEKLLAMKGSIYRKLGKTKQARETWERVLQLNPENTTVSDALRELSEKSEEGGQ
jgi:tetratricopeptide (TPR) repeat protein